jgi:hypothetical protein
MEIGRLQMVVDESKPKEGKQETTIYLLQYYRDGIKLSLKAKVETKRETTLLLFQV